METETKKEETSESSEIPKEISIDPEMEIEEEDDVGADLRVCPEENTRVHLEENLRVRPEEDVNIHQEKNNPSQEKSPEESEVV